jgi:5-methylcytosine-specific restriction protein A
MADFEGVEGRQGETVDAFEGSAVSAWAELLKRGGAGPLIARTWSLRDGDGKVFEASVRGAQFDITGAGIRSARVLAFSDFSKVFSIWDAYRFRRLSRKEVGDVSQNSSYIFGLIRLILDPSSKELPHGLQVSSAIELGSLCPGQTFRRVALHERFGGQRQGGISTPAEQNLVMLFTGGGGAQHGYDDGWVDGVFCYFGEGQVGDMPWARGNRAIRDHVIDGKELLLFRNLEKPRSHVEFVGRFIAGSWEYREAPDRGGISRKAIAFHLTEVGRAGVDETVDQRTAEDRSLEQLRRIAMEGGSDMPECEVRVASRIYIARSQAVKNYALARAKGRCERCGRPAPFSTAAGTPFLEVHHILRLADAGPDRIDAVAAVCPNCHREAHHGMNSRELNAELYAQTQEKEAGFGHARPVGQGIDTAHSPAANEVS